MDFLKKSDGTYFRYYLLFPVGSTYMPDIISEKYCSQIERSL